MKALLACLLIVSLSACYTRKQCLSLYDVPEPTTHTVVESKIEYRDTTVFVNIKADTTIIIDTIAVISNGIVNHPLKRLDLQYCWSEFWITNNNVSFKLYQKEAELQSTINKAIKEATTVKEVIINKPYPIKLPFTWKEKALMKLGTLFAFLLFCSLVNAGLLIGLRRFRSKIPF